MRRIGVLSSGGDTPGMNAAIRAIVMVAEENGIETYGIRGGFRGMINGDIVHLDPSVVRTIAHKGGTILKTSRCPEFVEKEGQERAVQMAQAYDLDGVVTIGGDGTMRGAAALCALNIPTITLPGTIDNDLSYTDYTIGFDTAVSGVINEIIKIRDTMVSHDRIGVVEVMGNRCGDIALHAGLAGSMDYIILPEMEYDIDVMCAELKKKALKGHPTSMIVVAEGAAHGNEMAKYINSRTGLDTKSVVLGYTQRGGSPTARDRILAARLGQHAVRLLTSGVSNRAVGVRGDVVVDMDIMEALEKPKVFNRELYDLACTLVRQ
ncbi:MAG: 6-phosphofructokinase [Clostridia bacterium]|nr:6-phosphofructokinase [Clostridia bacterium]MBQ9989209.1 6-phosphofructokinase [Clostridia bacterium]